MSFSSLLMNALFGTPKPLADGVDATLQASASDMVITSNEKEKVAPPVPDTMWVDPINLRGASANVPVASQDKSVSEEIDFDKVS